MDEHVNASESDRLRFEPLRAEHAALLFEALGDPRVSRHLNREPPASIDELSRHFADVAAGPPPHLSHQRWVDFAVRAKAGGEWIGRVESTVHGEWAEVAYLFGPAHWGQGYTTESLAWLRRFLESQHGVTEFWAAWQIC